MQFKYYVVTSIYFALVHSQSLSTTLTCNGLECQQTTPGSILSNLELTFKGKIDFTEINKILKAYIQTEIQASVEKAMERLKMDTAVSNEKRLNQTLEAKLIELTSTVMQQLEENKKAIQTEVEQKIKQTELNLEQKAMAPRQGCQSGTIGEHAYPQVRFPLSQNVTFNPPFKDIPAVVYGLYLLDSSKDHNVRVTTSLSNLSRNGFTLGISTFADTIMWGARVSWMACPKTF